MSLPISEIFYSLQGEGWDTGCASVFVRLHGCENNCSFCDTRDIPPPRFYRTEELINEVNKYVPCRNIVITGGEPLRTIPQQMELKNFILALRKETNNHCKISIETSGSVDPLPELTYYTSITCSPKQVCNWRICSGARYLKYVVIPTFTAEIPPLKWHNKIFLQPLWNVSENDVDQRSLNQCLEYIKKEPHRFRLSLQTHKYIGVR